MIVARGIFQWDGSERRSDRYGTFAITAHDEDSAITTKGEKVVFSDFSADDHEAFANLAAIMDLEGKNVSIKVKVIETRQSRHVGDVFRGIKPSTPKLGTVIDLGIGELYIEHSTWPAGECCGDVFIGLKPADGRDTDWFDPRKLYQLHCQTVEVEIEETDAVATVDPNTKKMATDGFTAVFEPAGENTFQIKRID